MNIATLLAHAGHHHEAVSTSILTPEETATVLAIAAFIIFATLVLSVIMYVLTSLCLMSIFKRAGVKPWIAWVPFYNQWKMLEIGGQQGFWVVLSIIPVVNIVSVVFMYIAMYNIGLKFGKGGAFVLLAIFLPVVWLIWLAVEKNPWDETAGAPSLAGPSEPIPPSADTTKN